ncbi:hypothetical protein D5F01_LYC14205 [Larimichthys crocea]|uniref:C-type lectin domain-containing protein n=2 Tax=Larimichthys crocea TaxID=215358 RepID=A0A6G0I9P1_LARCR|nr:ladderlectin [Larimichthys crocea]KAE8288137.1 hypothetical protein D5F01_LYC14198 [Larimichthys crocea]KAE8288144.1 hypothetical protein D5F01_LYC14205 [Larimichthys crocea]
MKTVLVLAVLICAAFAAPAEDKEKVEEAAVEAPEEHMDAPSARYNFCPNGWFSHGSRCFKFVNTPMTWYNAEEHCNAMGGHLASATNPREYSFLQQITQTAGQSIGWLGGFHLQGRWMWIDREGFYYTNFYSPSSASSYPCLYLRTANGWGNTGCSSSYRFICSMNPFGC